MNKLPNQLLFIIFILIISQVPAYCKTNYSLYELAQLANVQSEQIKIAKEDVYIAEQDKARALSVLIPRATGYGSITEHQDDFLQMPDNTVLGVKLTQSFTLNGKELIALSVTEDTIEGKAFSLESTRSQYLLRVAQAYYNILSAERFLEIALSDVERLKAHKNAVTEKLSVGNVTRTALYRAEAELSKSLTNQVIAENRVLESKAAMKNLVEIDDEFDLIREDTGGIEKYETTLEDIQKSALNNRTEIKQAKKDLEIAGKMIKYEKSAFWPTVEFEAGYRETDNSYDSGSGDIKYTTDDLYIRGELVFTLYDGGLRKAQVRQASAGQRKSQDAYSLIEKSIILDSKVSFLNYMAAKSTIVNLQDELKSSQENYNAVQMQFEYGMADSIDIMDANTLLVTAQRRILDAKYIYYLSVLKIIYTRGDLISFLLKQG